MQNTVKGAVQVLFVDRLDNKVSSKFYETLDDLFVDFSEYSLKTLFGSTDNLYVNVKDEVKSKLDYRFRYDWYYYEKRDRLQAVHYVALDRGGKFISSDRLVGLYREWRRGQVNFYRESWHSASDRGKKKSAYGGFRYIKTTQERRMDFIDPEATELGIEIRVRNARNAANLPTAWDDFWAHNQKCWKKQSKRDHQWK